MERLMNKIMKKVGAVCISIFMLFTLCMPCFADEKQKTIRVGSFEDTFNYVDDHGVRRGYGYELMQALAGYTGWKFEYVKCDWSNCFDKLENGEIDIMGDIAYTDDRAKEMLFSEETMGEEKYVLYANLSDTDILSSDYKSLDGKRIGVLKGTEPEYMLTEWENKYGIHTEHVNVSGNEDVKKKLANNEIDCFVSLEESIWSERGISSVTTIGKSDIYFAINKERSDIKQELDHAMRQLDSDSPFFKADLYKKYFTLDYTQFLTGNEKSWLEEHGGIRIGFLNNDPIVFSMDKKSGEIRGSLPEYVSYAKDCLGNHTLKFDIQVFDDYDKMIEALQNKEIDVIYYASRNSNVAEKKGYALSNTAWTYNLIAVTNKEDFNENDSYVVAVPKNKVALKQHIAYNYPQWKLVDCDSIEDGANMVVDGKVDCFIKESSQVLKFDGNKNFKIISLTKTMEACFGIKDGQATLLSILNKTIKAMPSDMLTSAIAMYDSTAYKMTFYGFLKDHLAVVLILGLSIIIVILQLLRKARRAEASAKEANLAKTQFLHNVSHDIRTPMNAILGYSELMKNELKDNDFPKVLEHLNKLQKAGNILLSIINNVLDMARIESGHMELDENYVNIEDIRQRLFEMFEDEAKKKNIHVSYTFNVEHKHVMADVTKVEEIFVNILSNAVKYTPSNGSIEVNVDELSCDEPGYMIVRTSIMDTGIGMSQEYLEKIFESFSRERMTSSKISGTGLGMAIVKKYVDLLGGIIDVKSVLGKGSTFIVTLKYKMADEKYYLNKQEENCEVDNAIFNGKHILLAEDNDLNAEIAQTILERAGLFVDRVKNGIECVNKVIENPCGTYDVILMDIQMPKMDGYKATCEIRNLQDTAKACIPIVAITANAFEEDKKKAIDAGMDGHIAKPINIEDLFVVLTDIMNKHES